MYTKNPSDLNVCNEDLFRLQQTIEQILEGDEDALPHLVQQIKGIAIDIGVHREFIADFTTQLKASGLLGG